MEARQKIRNVLVVHGPNLNLLGTREPDIYGQATLNDVNSTLEEMGHRLGLAVETFQSNHEGAIVDKIQQAVSNLDGLIINPAAYTHTSIAIRDALAMLDIPIIEIHISNIYKRESFRQQSLIGGVVTAQIKGFGIRGYFLALQAMAEMID